MARAHSTAVDILLHIGRVLILGMTIGTLASLAAMAFLELVAFLNDQLFISSQSRRKLDDNGFWLIALTILVPSLGGLVVGWLVTTIKDQRPHNPSDVIEAIQCQTADCALRVKDSITSVTASIISLGAGASVGQYGPIVHLGAFLGYRLPFLGKIDPALSIGCGVAAAIATVFNAPIAGVILAHEVFLRHLSLRAFAPITVASSVGFYLANYVFDREPLFRTAVAPLSNGSEFFAFIGIGIVGAFLAVIFMRLLFWCNQTARRVPIPQMYKPMLAGFVLGLVATQIPEVLGIGGDTLILALTPGGFEASELAIILIAKILMTALCIGFGFAGGVFSPALLIGVLYGALVAAGIDWLAPNMHSALVNYAIAGMAAVTSPVIGAPLATILIVFELTRSYELATVVMVSVVFSNIVAYRLFGRSLFDQQLKARGYDLENGREQIILNHEPLAPLIVDDYCRCQSKDSLYDVRGRLVTMNHSEAHIVDKQQRYLGSVRLNDILRLEETMDIRVEKIKFHLNAELIVYTDDMSVGAAMQALQDFVGESIPVIDADNRQLLGVVYESTLIQAYLDLAKQLQAERNAAS